MRPRIMESPAGVSLSRPMDVRRVLRGAGLAIAAGWPALATLLVYTDVAALWGGGRIGLDPDGFYWVFLTAFSASLLLFAESVRRRSWLGICLGALYLCSWTIGGWAAAVLPPPGL
jgi:hypothetical protein